MVLFEHIERLVKGEHWNPRDLLGPHQTSVNGSQAFLIKTFAPDANEARVILDIHGSKPVRMHRIHESGLFEATLDAPGGTLKYRIQIIDSQGTITDRHDPYAFAPMVSDHDLHLFSEGRLFKAYDTLGAHVRTI